MLVGLTGCGILPDVKTPVDLYTLSPKNTFDGNLPNVYWQLVVETPVAAAGINTSRIAIAGSPLSTDYYATAAWTDRAPLMVQGLLIESFENTKRIVAVARDAIGLRGNYVLQTELREFQAETYYGAKPVVRVRLNAKIIRMPERQIIGSRTIERCSEAANDQVPSVVAAFDDALGAVLKRTVTWVLTTPPPRASEQDDNKLVERFRDPSNIVFDSDRCPADNKPVVPAAPLPKS
jgi:cholesterol transport system auxiliary component